MLDFYAIRILNQSPRRSNFGREVAPHGFLLRSSEKSRREVAPQDIHFRSNSAPRHSEKNWQRGRATSFPFWIEIRESAVLDWGCATFTLQKECHVVFFPIKGSPREHSRENSRIATTQLRHRSPLLWWDPLKLFHQDPIDCIQSLINNLLLRNILQFEPLHVFKTMEKLMHVYSKWGTGNCR